MDCKTCRKLEKDFIQPRSERMTRLMKQFRNSIGVLSEDWDADLSAQEMRALNAIIEHKIEHGQGMRMQVPVQIPSSN
jgi:hypothetical protein